MHFVAKTSHLAGGVGPLHFVDLKLESPHILDPQLPHSLRQDAMVERQLIVLHTGIFTQ